MSKIAFRDDPSARRELLLEQVASLQRKLSSKGNSNIDFITVRNEFPELAQILFTGRDLRRTILRNADLRGLDFRDSDLSGCDFEGAQISGARFERAKVSRAVLKRARDWTSYAATWTPDEDEPPSPSLVRAAGERFSLSPALPEMALLSPRMAVVAALSDAEEHALRNGRLALAMRPVTNREFVIPFAPWRVSDARDDLAVLQVHEALTYCRQLSDRTREFGLPKGTVVVLPSFALCSALAALDDGPIDDLATDMDRTSLAMGVGGGEFVQTENGDIATFSRTRKTLSPLPPVHPARFRPLFMIGVARG